MLKTLVNYYAKLVKYENILSREMFLFMDFEMAKLIFVQ